MINSMINSTINKAQLQLLQNIAKTNNAEKVVYFDFDGIFSSDMLYTATEKYLKNVQYSARYAIEMLRFYGFQVNVITGDASGNGLNITNTILERIPVSNILSVSGTKKYDYLKQHHKLSTIFYAGDDLFDLAMTDCIFLTTANAFAGLKNIASYVALSSSRDYAILEFAYALLAAFDIDASDYAYKTRLKLHTSAIAAHDDNKLPLCVITSSSILMNSEYNETLYNVYNTNIAELVQISNTQSNSAGVNTLTVDNAVECTYVITSMQFFASFLNINSLPKGEYYVLVEPEHITIDNLIAINKHNNLNYAKVQLMTRHLASVDVAQIYYMALANNLHNVLSMLDMLWSDVS